MDEFDAFWQATTAQLKTHLRQLNTESSSVWDTVQAFVHAVDWREPWIRALCAFHVLMYACAYATTRSDATQAAVFVSTTGLLYASRLLNRAAGARWASFSTQNYFDEQGLFAGVVWCAPLILLQTAMVVGFLVRAARLLVRVKRLELRRRASSARQEDDKQAGRGGHADGEAVRRRQGRRMA